MTRRVCCAVCDCRRGLPFLGKGKPRTLFERAVGDALLGRLAGFRLFDELKKCFKEADPFAFIGLFCSSGLAASLDASLSLSAAKIERAKELFDQKFRVDSPLEDWELCFGLLLSGLSQSRANEFLQRLDSGKSEERKALVCRRAVAERILTEFF